MESLKTRADRPARRSAMCGLPIWVTNISRAFILALQLTANLYDAATDHSISGYPFVQPVFAGPRGELEEEDENDEED